MGCVVNDFAQESAVGNVVLGPLHPSSTVESHEDRATALAAPERVSACHTTTHKFTRSVEGEHVGLRGGFKDSSPLLNLPLGDSFKCQETRVGKLEKT
eukprot:4659445-Amphidinium_carterae.1